MTRHIPDGPDFFHGTVQEGLTEILPTTEHGGPQTFRMEADGEYAYATDEGSAWWYAEAAWRTHSEGIPRVYRVRATGPIEADPAENAQGRARSTFEADVRSRSAFIVVEEMPMPERLGDPEDWR